MHYYILDENKNLVRCTDLKAWLEWFSTHGNRVSLHSIRVALNDVDGPEAHEDIRVSTVFLGLNHGLFGDGPPRVFETMVFGGEYDGYQVRTSSWAEAEAEHQKTCRIVGIKDI